MALVGANELIGLEYLKHLFDEQELDQGNKESDLSNNINKKKNPLSSFPSDSSPRVHDWSELPRDISNLIADKLRFLPHLQKFGGTCKEWHGITSEILTIVPTTKVKCEPPMLLLPYNQETQIATFLETKESKMYDLKMPELKDQWICGASYGWLAMTNNKLDLFLLNPLTRVRIKLPPLDPSTIACFHWKFPQTLLDRCWCRRWFISRVVLSGDPSSSNCFVAIIYLDWYWLGVCRLGDENWSVTKPHDSWRDYEDVIFFQGRIFAVVNNEQVHVFDYSRESGLSFVKLIQYPHRQHLGRQLNKHLVESCGELLLVYRFSRRKKYERPRRPHKTCKFRVFKLKADMNSWDMVNNLGERLLFLGPNDSISVSAKEFPWCKSNCIYFTQEFEDTGGEKGFHWDNGMYSLKEDRVLEKFDIHHSLSFWSTPALWFRAEALKI